MSEDSELTPALPKNNKPQNDKLVEPEPLVYTFDDAIRLAGCGKFHYQLLITCGLCFLSVMGQIIATSIILPNIKCDLAATLYEQGLLGSAGFFGVVCGSYPMGFLADTWGRVRTLKCSLILSTILGLLSGFSVNIWMLIVTRWLTGALASGCQACVFSLCSEFHSSKTRSRHVTLISVFLSLSLIYLSGLAVLVIPWSVEFTLFGLVMTSWRFFVFSVNIAGILALIFLFYTPETPKFELVHGNHDQALATIRKIFARNTGRDMEEYPVRQIKLEAAGANISDIHGFKDAVKMIWSQTIPVFYKERVLHTLNICLVLFLSYGIAHGLFVWYPTILNEKIRRDNEDLCLVISEIDFSVSESNSGCRRDVETLTFWILVFIGVVFTVVYLIFASIVQKFGKRNILVLWAILCAANCIAVHWISSLPATVVAFTLIATVSNLGGIVGAIAVEFFPTNINAMAMCFCMMIGRLGAVAGNNIFGLFIFDYCSITFWGLTGAFIFMGAMCWLLPEQKKQKSQILNKVSESIDL